MTELPTWLTISGAIAAALGSIGGLAGLKAWVTARAEKHKIEAEADKTSSEADKVDAEAAAQLTTVALQLVAPLRDEVGRLTGRVSTLESDARVQHMLLVEHSVWDHVALARMKEAGVELPAIPPLFPPRPAAQAEVKVEVTTTSEPAT